MFTFGVSRASVHPREILGTSPLKGYLVVDRYAGYNQVPVRLQYCYSHLLRAVEDIDRDTEASDEAKNFSLNMGEALSKAMKLHSNKDIDAESYDSQAKVLQEQIMGLAESPTSSLAVKGFQNIFLDETDRLFRWVEDRAVPLSQLGLTFRVVRTPALAAGHKC